MQESIRQIDIGIAKVFIFNIGNIYLPLANYMNIDTVQVENTELTKLKKQTMIPIHNILIQQANNFVLVDVGVYDVETEPEYAIPNYVPPLSLIEQLNYIGVHPKDIKHVIITHRHWDHFNGTTCISNSKYVSQFSNAKYYLGKSDWERAQTKLRDPQSIEFKTLRVLYESSVLDIVDGNCDIGNGIQIIATPGETPGHQIVRFNSDDKTIYCLGDLYHHPIEFTYPELKVSWAEIQSILASRKKLIKQTLTEQAILIATHIPSIGQIKTDSEKVYWEEVLPNKELIIR